MDTGNIIAFLKKFSFVRLIGSGIVLRVLIAIVDGIFNLEVNELPNFNFYIFSVFSLNLASKVPPINWPFSFKL